MSPTEFGKAEIITDQGSHRAEGGLYGLSRNPQSAAFVVSMVGYFTLWPTWRNAGVLLLVMVLIHLMIRTEEEHLSAVFGPEYTRYLERVPRYFGRIE